MDDRLMGAKRCSSCLFSFKKKQSQFPNQEWTMIHVIDWHLSSYVVLQDQKHLHSFGCRWSTIQKPCSGLFHNTDSLQGSYVDCRLWMWVCASCAFSCVTGRFLSEKSRTSFPNRNNGSAQTQDENVQSTWHSIQMLEMSHHHHTRCGWISNVSEMFTEIDAWARHIRVDEKGRNLMRCNAWTFPVFYILVRGRNFAHFKMDSWNLMILCWLKQSNGRSCNVKTQQQWFFFVSSNVAINRFRLSATLTWKLHFTLRMCFLSAIIAMLIFELWQLFRPDTNFSYVKAFCVHGKYWQAVKKGRVNDVQRKSTCAIAVNLSNVDALNCHENKFNLMKGMTFKEQSRVLSLLEGLSPSGKWRTVLRWRWTEIAQQKNSVQSTDVKLTRTIPERKGSKTTLTEVYQNSRWPAIWNYSERFPSNLQDY